MSIICYTGLPGHGKSYSVVENVVIPALRDGRTVAHNLQLREASLAVVVDNLKPAQLVQIPNDATPEQLIAACPPGAVIVIDEVWRYWPAGVKANEVPKEELKFFKEHRHRVGEDGIASEIVVIDQDPKTGIPAFLRALIEVTYIHEKMSKVGAAGSFRVDVYNRCQSAEKPSKSALLRKMTGRYRPEVWNCYVSHTQAKRVGEAGLELAADDRASVWKSWTVRASMVAALALPLLFWFAWDSFGDLSGKPQPSTPTKRVPQAHESPTAFAAAPSTATPPSQPQAQPEQPRTASAASWTVIGVVQRLDGTGIALLKSSLGERRLKIEDHCRLDPLNWTCEVDGETSAPWTGATWRTFAKTDRMNP